MFWSARLAQALSRQAAGCQLCRMLSRRAGPRLVPHHRVVAEQVGHGRSFRQGLHLGRRPRLQLGAVLDDRRTGRRGRPVRTGRPAAAQQARRDREDDEPPPPAFPAERHWSSPMLRGAPAAGRAARRSGGRRGGAGGPRRPAARCAGRAGRAGLPPRPARRPAITAGPASSRRAGRRSRRRCRRARRR